MRDRGEFVGGWHVVVFSPLSLRLFRHCEEPLGDEANQSFFVAFWIASLRSQ
jgi:hypothetical protein